MLTPNTSVKTGTMLGVPVGTHVTAVADALYYSGQEPRKISSSDFGLGAAPMGNTNALGMKPDVV